MANDLHILLVTRAKELCRNAGLDPDFWSIVGWDFFGAVREQNWEAFLDEAREEIKKK